MDELIDKLVRHRELSEQEFVTLIEGRNEYTPAKIYKLDKFKDIADYCESKKIRLWD